MDNTLTEGIYKIPSDLRAFVTGGNTIHVIKRRAERHYGAEHHCRDCEHCKEGKLTIQGQWYISNYCEMKPKVINKKPGYYYAAGPHYPACEMFKPKENGVNNSPNQEVPESSR